MKDTTSCEQAKTVNNDKDDRRCVAFLSFLALSRFF